MEVPQPVFGQVQLLELRDDQSQHVVPALVPVDRVDEEVQDVPLPPVPVSGSLLHEAGRVPWVPSVSPLPTRRGLVPFALWFLFLLLLKFLLLSSTTPFPLTFPEGLSKYHPS